MRANINTTTLIARGHSLSARYTALHHRNFRLFWFGQMISLVGTWMQNVAQGWLVYQLTGSALALGMVGVATSLPVLGLALYGGVIADRFNRRNILMVTQTAAMIQALVMAGLIWGGHIQVWHVYLLSFTLGIINAIDTPTRQAFVVDLVAKQDLPNAVALNSTVFNLARVVGPAVAAILIASVGIAAAYFINGLTFVAVLIGLWMINMPEGIVRSTTRSIKDNLVEGFAYIRSDPPTQALIGMVAVIGLFGIPYTTLMPVFADAALHTDVHGYGLLLSATGVGALISAFTLASFSNMKGKGKFLTVGDLVFPLMLIAFSFSRSMPVALILLVGIGGFLVLRAALSNILLQTTVPDALRGRVMAVYIMMFFGMTPLGSFISGAVAERFGAPVAIASGGVIVFIAAIFVFVRFPSLRRLE